MGEAELYQPLWSATILHELRRNLIEEAGLKKEAVVRRLANMDTAFPNSRVQGFEHLIPEMENDYKDRHVLAAAVWGEAKSIVTANVKDFPKAACDPHMISIFSPDDFLLELLNRAPNQVTSSLRKQVSRYRDSPKTINGLSDCLSRTAPAFAAQIFDGYQE